MGRGLVTTFTGVLRFVALGISVVVVTSSAQSWDDSNAHSLAENRERSEYRDTVARGDPICFTTECIHTASRISANMNPKIEPCADFYKFACDGFAESNVIPDDESNVGTFSVINEKLDKQLREAMDEPSKPDDRKPFTLAKNLYKACMNETAIERAGFKPLKKIIGQLGRWPLIEGDNWKADEFHWTKIVYNLGKLGYSLDYFVSFNIDIDPKNGTRRIIFFDEASLGLSREYLSKGFEDKIVKAYFKYMVDIAVILGAKKQRATQELKESLEFEMKLANISLPSEKRRDFTVLYNPMTIAQLKKRYPSIDWKEYINELLAPSVRVDDAETVIVSVPSFISDLEELLRNTPKRVQANYVMWRVAEDTVSYLSKDIREIQFEYIRAVSGKTGKETRWKECVDVVAEYLWISIGALYVRKYFEKAAKKTASEMVADISREFAKILEEAEWMDENTRRKALEKAAAMTRHIAYPDELLDDKKLEEFYTSLELRPDDFVGNIQNLNLYYTKYSLEMLRKPVNKSEWIRHSRSADVNAFYDPGENSIEIPAGILQGVFFNNERPRYMNYGAIGFVIGHEITHGFDDQGRQFDKEGNLVDWWAPETKEKYLEKAECIIDQYGNYTDESVGLNLNGIITQGENIADNGGIKEAYLAYKEWAKRNGPEPKLPGLEYTPEQMFWISAANNWCAKCRPEFSKLSITIDPHSPSKYRVLGPFSNMPEFAADFDCPVGSAMNPKHKCSVW